MNEALCDLKQLGDRSSKQDIKIDQLWLELSRIKEQFVEKAFKWTQLVVMLEQLKLSEVLALRLVCKQFLHQINDYLYNHRIHYKMSLEKRLNQQIADLEESIPALTQQLFDVKQEKLRQACQRYVIHSSPGPGFRYSSDPFHVIPQLVDQFMRCQGKNIHKFNLNLEWNQFEQFICSMDYTYLKRNARLNLLVEYQKEIVELQKANMINQIEVVKMLITGLKLSKVRKYRRLIKKQRLIKQYGQITKEITSIAKLMSKKAQTE